MSTRRSCSSKAPFKRSAMQPRTPTTGGWEALEDCEPLPFRLLPLKIPRSSFSRCQTRCSALSRMAQVFNKITRASSARSTGTRPASFSSIRASSRRAMVGRNILFRAARRAASSALVVTNGGMATGAARAASCVGGARRPSCGASSLVQQVDWLGAEAAKHDPIPLTRDTERGLGVVWDHKASGSLQHSQESGSGGARRARRTAAAACTLRSGAGAESSL
eukprot:scaffold66_cov390-Prasinococcus_capsulatus_cf.AAC.4